MMRKIGIVLFCTVFVGTLYARDITESQKFIGIEAGISEVQGGIASEIDGSTSKGTTFGLRVGARAEEWRTLFSVNNFDDEGRNVEKLLLAVDYLFLGEDALVDYAMQPYIGLNAGYANYESLGVDEDGFLYGGQAGIIVDIVEELSLDIGFRYSLSSSDALDHTQDIIFGMDYKF
ncbi:MAG: Unknown protein [uncultured Sulfurovum sp.]|uniref:Outer membrane protein beta-barrel domain-containing protein n=1 Tax=uncultured Sulfurovum sp. TaxID=269237 RepID=A0A6S6TS45_9BACT|nr:MAG: Unknown protein [uncultured Sulfurovum sp.]